MRKLEEKLERQVNDICASLDKYWDEHEDDEGDEGAESEFIAQIESMISEYGYNKVAEAFHILTTRYCLTFDEYTTDDEAFELNEDISLDEEDEFYTYKAYCRWRPYWPLLIPANHMRDIKEYESRVRACHGKFFTLTRQALRLPAAIFNQLWNWESDGFDWNDYDYYHDLFDMSWFSMTDAEFAQMHAKYQRGRIKAIVLELIENSKEMPLDAIKAYTFCQTRSVTPDGWGPDVYVLSESDRADIIQALSDKAGGEVANLFDKDSKNDSYYLWGTDDRSDAFGICFEDRDHYHPSYRPDVDTEKYLLPVFPVNRA